MNLAVLIGAAFAIGIVAGLRSMTPVAWISWAARVGTLDLHGSHLAFLGSTAAFYTIVILAAGELITDKLPFTPRRTLPPSLAFRIFTGAACGAAFYVSAHQPVVLGIILGGLGAVAGTYGGYQVRKRLVQALRVPDIAIALAEDVLAIAMGFFLVTHF